MVWVLSQINKQLSNYLKKRSQSCETERNLFNNFTKRFLGQLKSSFLWPLKKAKWFFWLIKAKCFRTVQRVGITQERNDLKNKERIKLHGTTDFKTFCILAFKLISFSLPLFNCSLMIIIKDKESFFWRKIIGGFVSKCQPEKMQHDSHHFSRNHFKFMFKKEPSLDFENQLPSSGTTVDFCTVARRRNLDWLLSNVFFTRRKILIQVSIFECWGTWVQV